MRRLPALLASALMLAAGLTGCTPRPNSAEPTAAAFLDAISSRQFGELASLVDDPSQAESSTQTTWEGLQAERLEAEITDVT